MPHFCRIVGPSLWQTLLTPLVNLLLDWNELEISYLYIGCSVEVSENSQCKFVQLSLHAVAKFFKCSQSDWNCMEVLLWHILGHSRQGSVKNLGQRNPKILQKLRSRVAEKSNFFKIFKCSQIDWNCMELLLWHILGQSRQGWVEKTWVREIPNSCHSCHSARTLETKTLDGTPFHQYFSWHSDLFLRVHGSL